MLQVRPPPALLRPALNEGQLGVECGVRAHSTSPSGRQQFYILSNIDSNYIVNGITVISVTVAGTFTFDAAAVHSVHKYFHRHC